MLKTAVGLPIYTRRNEQMHAPLYDRDVRRNLLKHTEQTPAQIKLMLDGWRDRRVIDEDEHGELMRVFGPRDHEVSS